MYSNLLLPLLLKPTTKTLNPNFEAQTMYNSILRQRSKSLSDALLIRIFTRSMGGGPRTFPGGINKWQWKRLHEKRAKEKEKRLLDQEKQLYQSRIRSEIRFNLTDDKTGIAFASCTYSPMSPKEHVKALTDRFMKEGAEDFWNEDDGPLKSDVDQGSGNRRPSIGSVSNNINRGVGGFNYTSRRDYTTQSLTNPRRNERAPRDNVELNLSAKTLNDKQNVNTFSPRRNERAPRDDVELNLSAKTLNYKRDVNSFMKRRRFNRYDSSSSDEENHDAMEGSAAVWDTKRRGSSASLGKYDTKKTKRVPLKEIEQELDFEGEVEMIRKEITKFKLTESPVTEEESILSEKWFDESGISPLTVKVLSEAGYTQMTRVQEATLAACLDGMDALVKSKTGTGKSAAFLIPAIETVLKDVASNAVKRVPPICVLVLCPTRELASQIAAEAKALLKYHDGVGVQTLVGGTRFKEDQKRLDSDPSQIVVATPGRLLDHVENKSGLSVRLMGLKMLILDESDHLLDLGFRKDVEKIVDCLPRRRQTLLFSATVPKEVRRISQVVLKREHVYIDTVGLGCETPVKIKQSFVVAPHSSHFQLVHSLVREHVSQVPDYKVIIFCITGMVTSLLYHLLREMKMNVRELHSRKPQIYRTRISEEFKESKQLILVTSDVSARGMNYPDVTLVIQVGIPSDREQYIHRLGRTGREGKEGEGILLLAPWEEYFLDELKGLPLEECPLPQLDPDINNQIVGSMGKIDSSVKEAAYHAWLGYYNSMKEIGRDKTTLVELANQFCESIGLERPPALYRKTALKMGLKDISGIRIRK